MPAESIDPHGSSDDHARLRTAKQLVTAEGDDVGTFADAADHRRLVAEMRMVLEAQPAAAEIFHERKRESSREQHQLAETRPLSEAFDPKIRWVHAQNRGRPIADGRGVIG